MNTFRNSTPRLPISLPRLSLSAILLIVLTFSLLRVSPAHASETAAPLAPTSTLTVTSTADSGAGTLRQAIADAGTGDTIDFNLTYPATITLTSGELVIASDLTITGPGAANLTVSGNHANRVFNITGGTVHISGLTIRDGYTVNGSGGGIQNNGAVTVTSTTFLTNTAKDAGGIENTGTMTVDNSAFSGNAASGVGGSGGGIRNDGTLTVTNSTFITNTAVFGGGIENNSTLTVVNSTFSDNSGVGGEVYGGGIYNNATLLISNSSFITNTANYGGGIYNNNALTISHSTFSGNAVAGSFGYGGGIFNNLTLTVTNSTFSGNSSQNSGGGINNHETLLLSGSTFSGNSAGFDGGGIYSRIAMMVTDTTFMTNTAQYGGGINNFGTLTVTNTTFSGNAAGNWGGGVVNDGILTVINTNFLTNTAAYGGGIEANGALTVSNSTFGGNDATAEGGGVYANGAAVLNGDLFQNNHCIPVGCPSDGWITNSPLTLTQFNTTSDDIQNNGLTTQAADSVILFNGPAGQAINGTGSTTFSNVHVNNTGAGVSLGQNITVTNRLTLTTDLTTTASYQLNLTSGATSSGTGDVWGNTYRNHAFNFDTPYSFGNPNVSLSFGPTSTVPSAVLINLAHGAPVSFAYAFNRAYAITAAGGGAFSATLRLHYQDGEVNGLESGAQLWRYNGSVWTQQGKTASDTITNWVEQSGVSAFSPWAISSQTPTAITLQTFEATSTDQVFAISIGVMALLVLIGAALVIDRKRRQALRN